MIRCCALVIRPGGTSSHLSPWRMIVIMYKCNVNHHRRRFMLLVCSVAIVAVVLLLCGQQLRKLVPSNSFLKDMSTKPMMPASEGENKRLKRFIIFNGNGVVKLVLGVSFPIILPDTTRSLNIFYNLQMVYTPAPRPLYWWSLYNTTTFAARNERSTDILMRTDNSRRSIYEFIETTMQQRSGQFASECLLKAICEIARAPLTEDFGGRDAGDEAGHEYSIEDDYGQNIYHALINAIFTPQLPNVERRYWYARVAGSKGANCDELFAKCSAMNDWLKRFTRFI